MQRHSGVHRRNDWLRPGLRGAPVIGSAAVVGVVLLIVLPIMLRADLLRTVAADPAAHTAIYLPFLIRNARREDLRPPATAPAKPSAPTTTAATPSTPTIIATAATPSTPTTTATPASPARSSTPTTTASPTEVPAPTLTATIAPALRTFPDTTSAIRVFNDQLASGSMSEAQFAFAAAHYVGTQKVLRRDARRLRAYNPDFLVLHYRLAQALGYRLADGNCAPTRDFLQIIDGDRWVQEWPGDNVVADGWFFKWADQRVYSCTNGHYIMNLDDPGWREWWSGQVIGQLQANEDDAVFADSFSVPNYFGACQFKPCLPVVDAAFEADWARREHAFSDYMRGRFAGRWKWIPNVGTLVTTRDPSKYDNLDGAMVEGFAEWGRRGWLDPSDWQLQLNRTLGLVGADKIVSGQTYPDPTDVGERMFVMGTYLLVKGAHTYINMDTGLNPEWFPEYAIDLGVPTDPLPVRIADLLDPRWTVYVRRYERGMVLVNPTATDRSVDLGSTWQRVVPEGGGDVPDNGQAPGRLRSEAVRQVTVRGHGGEVLLK